MSSQPRLGLTSNTLISLTSSLLSAFKPQLEAEQVSLKSQIQDMQKSLAVMERAPPEAIGLRPLLYESSQARRGLCHPRCMAIGIGKQQGRVRNPRRCRGDKVHHLISRLQWVGASEGEKKPSGLYMSIALGHHYKQSVQTAQKQFSFSAKASSGAQWPWSEPREFCLPSCPRSMPSSPSSRFNRTTRSPLSGATSPSFTITMPHAKSPSFGTKPVVRGLASTSQQLSKPSALAPMVASHDGGDSYESHKPTSLRLVIWTARALLHGDPKTSRRKVSALRQLLSRRDIVWLQEAHGNADEMARLGRLMRQTHSVRFSPCSSRDAGGAMIFAPNRLKQLGVVADFQEIIKGRVALSSWIAPDRESYFLNVRKYALSHDERQLVLGVVGSIQTRAGLDPTPRI
jgi:hypothetical protein